MNTSASYPGFEHVQLGVVPYRGEQVVIGYSQPEDPYPGREAVEIAVDVIKQGQRKGFDSAHVIHRRVDVRDQDSGLIVSSTNVHFVLHLGSVTLDWALHFLELVRKALTPFRYGAIAPAAA